MVGWARTCLPSLPSWKGALCSQVVPPPADPGPASHPFFASLCLRSLPWLFQSWNLALPPPGTRQRLSSCGATLTGSADAQCLPSVVVPWPEGICSRPGARGKSTGLRVRDLGYSLQVDAKVLCDLSHIPVPLWASVFSLQKEDFG